MVRRSLWAAAALAALLAPLHAGPFDGIPLDAPLEALVVGVLVPVLIAFNPAVLDHRWARGAVLLIAALKAVSWLVFTPTGLCARFTTELPVVGPVAAIDVSEPAGILRTWDVRAHWGSGEPACSAVMRRDYPRRERFPAWFLNLLADANAPFGDLRLSLRGYVTVREPGAIAFELAEGATATLRANGETAASGADARVHLALPPGTHEIELQTVLSGTAWRVVPTWNGESLWSSALVTPVPPRRADGVVSRALPWATACVSALLILVWLFLTIASAPLDGASALWVLSVAAVAAIAASWPAAARAAPLLLGLVLLSPAARRHADARTMAWLVGVPWVAFATSLAWPLFGEFTLYSRGDDWLTYQVSAYRIYLQGAWLQAGEPLFYYQPLYRWIAGALHVVFGDSSAGELLWDCGWLLAGGFLAFAIARPLIGGRGALAAAVATLVLFALTPIWYLIGRGLAEISAAGFAWAAALLLMRARTGRTRLVLLAGTFGVLAYYARLNQMLFAGALLAFLLPLTLPARVLTEPRRLWREVPVRSAAIYAAVLVSGLGLLSLRAWFYTGETSPFAGTSFGLNHTGLAPGTLFSPEVWRNVAHSLFAQAIVNEEFDVRGLIVLGGCVAAVLALLQVPRLRQLPLGPALAVAGGLVGAFAAHAHGYPGRFSVHLVPLAAAVAAMAAWVMVTKAPPPPAGAPPTHAPTRPPR